jgi:hypothetical protein
VVTEDCPTPPPPEPDDPKAAAYIKMEHCHENLYSASLGTVTKISVRTLVSVGIVG